MSVDDGDDARDLREVWRSLRESLERHREVLREVRSHFEAARQDTHPLMRSINRVLGDRGGYRPEPGVGRGDVPGWPGERVPDVPMPIPAVPWFPWWARTLVLGVSAGLGLGLWRLMH